MRNKRWTEEEIIFLKENYPIKGSGYCANMLNRDNQSVMKKAHYIGIGVNKDVRFINTSTAQLKYQSERPNDSFKVNIEHFLNIDKPEVAYLLGFLWADGYIVRHEVRLEIIKTDMDTIRHILDSIGIWTYSCRKRGMNKPIERAVTSNKRLKDFLIEHDYDKKSYVSADKIINKIPNELKHYFFRGLVDGDGCIDTNRIRTSISSSFEQDWLYINQLCYELDVNSNIYRYKNKYSHSHSIIEFNGVNAIKFCDYIYNGNIFGLSRKYNNYLKIKECYINSRTYLLNIKKEKALSLYNSGMPIIDIIKTIKIPSTTLRRYLHSII